ncbi:hypothetical protein [Aureibacillus halotolerans]|uniref:Uncharacterized protein n=1 Tax=Aureibacillus halotolerans TaxID=1508390 RepID=A0A4R6TVK8_9BACI|nr:hypothetical protein [Aureibacillus halotolerans]TDQ35296.1 hypothetical protein EV213_12283 [Aureibacillus halotolerans]
MILIPDEFGRVILETFQPTEAQRKEGVEVAELPKPEHREGKEPVLYINEQGQPYYKYVERPLNETEKLNKEIDALKADLEANQLDNFEMMATIYEMILANQAPPEGGDPNGTV